MQDLTSGIIANVVLVDYFSSLGLSVLYALILGFVIKKYSRIIGDRSQYTIILITLMPTMVLVITVVKSSLALSLGLVGALSIVRFRTPIKEPEELVYLFIAIAVGLGLGASQILATTIAFFLVVLILVVWGRYRKQYVPQGLFLEVSGERDNSLDIKKLLDVFRKHEIPIQLRRYHEKDKHLNATFFVELVSVDILHRLIEDLKAFKQKIDVAVIDRSHHLG